MNMGIFSRPLLLLVLSATTAHAFLNQFPHLKAGSARIGTPLYIKKSVHPGKMKMAAVVEGDAIELDYKVKNEDGSFVDYTFDQGRQILVVGCAGGFPPVHKAVVGMRPDEQKTIHISPEEAYGKYVQEAAATMSKEEAGANEVKEGMTVRLWTGEKARITMVNDTHFTVDSNHPMAGKSFQLELKVLNKLDLEKDVETATFAAGCFWGLELAFQRVPGVISTAVGYTQGLTDNPTYSEVCSGKTGHAEAVQVQFLPAKVSFEELLEVFWGRHDPTQLNKQGNDVGTQYRGGVYYHSDAQAAAVRKSIEEQQKKYRDPIVTEVKEATTFWDGEEYHQHYLEKGGQDAKKNAEETIRCYG